jgi:hypothetical protein
VDEGAASAKTLIFINKKKEEFFVLPFSLSDTFLLGSSSFGLLLCRLEMENIPQRDGGKD